MQNYAFKERWNIWWIRKARFAELVDQDRVTILNMVITKLDSRLGMSDLKEIFAIILVLRTEYR